MTDDHLDDATTDELLATLRGAIGRDAIAPDDRIRQVLTHGMAAHQLDPAPQPAGSSPRSHRMQPSEILRARWAKLAVALGVGGLSFGGLAAAGALPKPVQGAVADVLAPAGLHVEDPYADVDDADGVDPAVTEPGDDLVDDDTSTTVDDTDSSVPDDDAGEADDAADDPEHDADHDAEADDSDHDAEADDEADDTEHDADHHDGADDAADDEADDAEHDVEHDDEMDDESNDDSDDHADDADHDESGSDHEGESGHGDDD